MLWGDYHTHTTYSRHRHGKGTVADNVRAALSCGLKEIALTDHGLRHITYGMTTKNLPRFLAEVERARRDYPGIKIYAGLEANFLSPRGETDLDGAADMLDIRVCGFHKLVRPLRLGDAFSFFLANILTKNSRKALARNTDAYLRALEKYEIDIISHPNHDCRIDLAAGGREAAARGTYLELNGRHRSMTGDDLLMLADLGCRFVMDSDAHTPSRVGDVAAQLEAVKECGLPMEYIHNWDRLPEFRSGRAK